MKLFARDALLPSGWAHDVLVDVDGDGSIRAVEVAFAAPADAERLQGPLIPGMPNVHSHAFQRALAGLTERGGPGADNFWTWRTEMYRFLERIGPDEEEAVAARASASFTICITTLPAGPMRTREKWPSAFAPRPRRPAFA